MKFHFFHIITFFMLVILATNAETLPPQLYWKSIIPNTPMSKAITNLLNNSPIPKATTNLLLPGVDVGVRKGYNDGGAADVNSEESPNPLFYRSYAAKETDAKETGVKSEESPNPLFYRSYAAKETDVKSEESPNPLFYHRYAARKTCVKPEESPNPLFYHRYAAKETGVKSKESPNPLFYHRYAAKETDVKSEESPNPLFYHRYAAKETNVKPEESPNPLFYHRYAAKETDVKSDESPNPLFYHRYAAKETDVKSEESPNPLFYHRYAARETDVKSKESPNPLFYHRYAARETDVNSEESPNFFIYRNYGARETDVNYEESPNPLFYRSYARSETQLHAKPNATIFFFEKDLHHRKKLFVKFVKTTYNNEENFLPREISNSIPFSSNKMEYILNKLNIEKGSKGARIVKNTISECEEEGIKGEEKHCVTSLESMIDFITSKLGKNVEALSTEINKESVFQHYTIAEGVKKLGDKNKVDVCHKVSYPYTVFYCHETNTTKGYSVPLEGDDGSRVKVIAVCYTNTSEWTPKHLAFQVLKVKPGTVPVYHLLPHDHVVWISK